MGPSPRPRSKVVFVCLHGAAKSIVAAELFRRYAAERDFSVDILARGLEPVNVLVRRSSLEDVFLRLTGRHLVD